MSGRTVIDTFNGQPPPEEPLVDEAGRPAPPYPDEGMMWLESTFARAPSPSMRPWLRGHGVKGFLDQSKYWQNIDNDRIPLSEIDGRYATNILGFLERKALGLLRAVAYYEMWAEAEIDEYSGEPERLLQLDPIKWMKKQRLYKAIERRAREW